MNEVFDRTLNFSPVYRALMNSVKNSGVPGSQAINAAPISGVELDDALAKLALGNTIAMSMFALANGDYGDDIILLVAVLQILPPIKSREVDKIFQNTQ